ncbi:MAG TPA: ABC transporter substrate-binding protein [Anaerolineae bacterium]|nr:ABC transporter substrate-binding protein [Anaerolineae bacterium]
MSQKARALLAYLALNPRPHTRDTLAGLLWGEIPQQRASGNLRVALSNLHTLFPEYLRIERRTVAFNVACPYWLDVAAFETLLAAGDLTSLQQATALYRGPLLEGFYLHEAPAFEEWLLVERERLHQAQLQALHRLVQCYAGRGEYPAAIEVAGRLLTLEPWREETHRELMRLLALTGQRGAALAQYERCRRLLRDELGLEPLAETTALYARIRAAETLSPSPALPPSTALLPFTGRGNEHARVLAWWEGVQHGVRSLLLVEGEAGAGKTRLMEEACRAIASHGATVLRGRCYEFGGALPYQPIAEALRAHLRIASPALEPSWQAELTRLLPELRVHLPPPAPDEGARQRLFEAVARFLTAAAPSGPVLLFLDDLHWADSATLDVLHYLVCCAAPAPLGLVGAYRPEELPPGHPLTRLRQSLSRDHQVECLRLERLPAAAVTELAASLVGRQASASLGAFLHRESEGNPFILMETLYALQEQGALARTVEGAWTWQPSSPTELLPASVQDMILQRVERLSAPTQQLLALAAVIGRRFDAALLQTVAPASDLVPALEEAFTRRLITCQPPPSSIQQLASSIQHPASKGQLPASSIQFDFTHDKIRAAVYHALPAAQRQMLHRQVAEALEQAPVDAEQVGPLAYHWEQAAEPMRAVDYLLRAGDHARLLYATQEAGDYYRRALAILEQQGDNERAARTWMKLGLTYHNAFDFHRARLAYDKGCARWQQATSSLPTTSSPATHTLRVRWEEPTSLDPLLAPDAHTSELVAHLFSGLVELGPDMVILPDVARTWEVSEDGRTLTFHLREEARWSDGTPVTAEDFVYAWRRALESPGSALIAKSMQEIKGVAAFQRGTAHWEDVGVKALDAMTLLLELEVPAGYFLHLLAHTPYYPIPRHIVAQHGDAWAAAENIVTNGLFMVESWDKGRCLTLTRHPAYHGRVSGNLSRVELYTLADNATRLERYAADALDILGITYFLPAERERARQRYADEYLALPRLCTCYLVFDTGRPPFDDVRVRQALALATDRAALADEALQGYATPATGGLTPPGMPGHVPGIALPYAPERARQLLAEAGYPDGRGFPSVPALAFRAVATHGAFLQAHWRAQLGLEIAWDVREWPEFLAGLRGDAPALFIAMWTADYPDPDDFLRVSRADHWSGWQHADYDALVTEARRDLDQAARLARYAHAERILVAEAPVLPLTYERDHLLLKPWVRRYPISGSRAIFWKDVILESREAYRDLHPAPAVCQ